MDSPSQTETRTRILIEAERLFRHYGYGKTTIADIAEVCGMSPANVYRFFPSKSALMEALCARLIAEMEMRPFEIVRRQIPIEERLVLFIEQIYRHSRENLIDHRKVHEMVAVAMEEQWQAIRGHIDRMTAALGELIADGIARGELPPQDPVRVGKIVHTAIVAFCHPILVAEKADDEDQVRPQEMAAFLLKALKSES